MSIAGTDPEPTDIAPKPTPETEKYQTARKLNSGRPLSNIVSFVEGYSWNVDYFGQVLASDDAVNPYSLSTSPTIQQYKAIKNLEIRVQSPQAYSLSKTDLEQTWVGEGILFPGSIIPSKYDVFLADVGLNRQAVFTVSNVDVKSALAEGVYEISYVANMLLDDATEADLKLKTVDEGYFSKDFMLTGQNPVLNEGTMRDINDLHDEYSKILGLLCDDFINKRNNFLTLPETPSITYDPYLHEFLTKIIETSQHKELRNLTRPSIRRDLELDVETIWDILFEGHDRRIERNMGVVDTRYVRGLAMYGSIMHTKLHRFIGPVGYGGVNSPFNIRATEVESLYPIDPISEVRPIIHNVDLDDNYVFSQGFYDKDDTKMSTLELLVQNYLDRKNIDSQDLFDILDTFDDWHPLERFYYTPVLLLLIQYVVRSI